MISFAKTFLEGVHREGRSKIFRRTKFSVLKMRNYMSILALRIENYSLDPKSMEFIARDFGINVSSVPLYFERVGAVRKGVSSKEDGDVDGKKWVLQLPINPKVRVLSAHKSKKKQN